jgi:hypothetical protein
MAIYLKQNIFFVTDQTPCPYPTGSLPAYFWHWCMEWSIVGVLSKPLIIEEIWPGRGLNLGLPNDTPVLYPLLQELMLWVWAFYIPTYVFTYVFKIIFDTIVTNLNTFGTVITCLYFWIWDLNPRASVPEANTVTTPPGPFLDIL